MPLSLESKLFYLDIRCEMVTVTNVIKYCFCHGMCLFWNTGDLKCKFTNGATYDDSVVEVSVISLLYRFCFIIYNKSKPIALARNHSQIPRLLKKAIMGTTSKIMQPDV